jgi:hypothetical protein
MIVKLTVFSFAMLQATEEDIYFGPMRIPQKPMTVIDHFCFKYIKAAEPLFD